MITKSRPKGRGLKPSFLGQAQCQTGEGHRSRRRFFDVYLAVPPVDGKANAALIKLLSKEYGVS
jgi:uncharacterized protein YggU (UPF0235/DUF167 family)